MSGGPGTDRVFLGESGTGDPSGPEIVSAPEAAVGDFDSERDAIRALLRKEFDTGLAGDHNEHIGCFDPSFVGFGAFGRPATEWIVWGDHHTLIQYSEIHDAERPKSWKCSAEVMHIDTRGDVALAVSQHVDTWEEPEQKRSVRNHHETVWILRKIGSEWRIVSWVWGSKHNQEVVYAT